MTTLTRPLYLWLDTELNLVHISNGCPEAKYAQKYHYLKSITVYTVEEARALDKRSRACPRCEKAKKTENNASRTFRYKKRRAQ
jgi:hypothetical protein